MPAARGRDAGRRRQGRRRRDPGLLLRAEARRAGRRLPDVPGRGRGHPEAPDRLLDPGPRRHGRLHADRPRPGGAERRRRVPPGQPPARLPGLRQGRRVPAPGHLDGLGRRAAAASPTRSATSRSPCRSRRWCGSTASAASSVTAASASRQEVAEDEQLQLLERGARSFVGTFDDRPYIAPFHGNIIELCPVGRPHVRGVPLPRPAVGHRGRRLGLHALPVAVQRQVHRPRRAGRPRPGRDNHEVDDGWLCDKGRFGFQMFHSEDRMLRADGPHRRRPRTRRRWDEALQKAAAGLKAAGPTHRHPDRQPGLERGGLPAPADRAPGARLAARRLARRARRSSARPRSRLSAPELGAAMARHRRRGVDPGRRHRPAPLDADPRPAAAQGDARPRHPRRHRLGAPDRARRRRRGDAPLRARRGGDGALGPRGRARKLRGRRRRRGRRADRGRARPGKTVVIYGERIGHGPDGERALAALLACAEALRPLGRRRRPARGARDGERARPARGRLPARPRAPASPRPRRA